MKGKRLKLITEILAIIAICLVSFIGVYSQTANKMVNKVKSYDFAKDLTGYRELVFEVSDATEVLDAEGKVVGNTDQYTDSNIESYSYQKTENKVNSEENLKEENYKKAKEVIEKRLKSLGVQNYTISQDISNGTIYLQLPEDNNTDHIVSNILEVSKFEIKDSEDSSNVFVTNDDLKRVSTRYNTTQTGTTVYLQIEFNKNGKKVIKDLSTGEYATKEEEAKEDENTENSENETSEDENAVEAEANISSEESAENSEESENKEENSNTTENSETSENSEESSDSSEDEEDTQKKIALSIDNSDMITTSFDDPIADGILNLSMNKETTDSESISDTLESTSTIATLLNSGKMPLTYKIKTNNYINTDISEEMLQKSLYVAIIVILIALLVLIIKHKLRGIIAAFAYIGFVALDLLLIRYLNVSVTLETIVSAIIILAINYIITYNLLKIKEEDKEAKKIAYSTQIKSTIMALIPIFIISIIFVFAKWTNILTFGMNIFWGIILTIIYNYLLTRDMLD